MEDVPSILFALLSATLSPYLHSCFSPSSLSATIFRMMSCTRVFPFHSFFSRLTTRERISPGSSEVISCFSKFQRRQDTHGSSMRENFIWFCSLPMILDSLTVTHSRSQRGRGLPMPKGRNRSIASIVSTVISLGSIVDSRESFFFGKCSVLP